jgi:hypothetical protein
MRGLHPEEVSSIYIVARKRANSSLKLELAPRMSLCGANAEWLRRNRNGRLERRAKIEWDDYAVESGFVERGEWKVFRQLIGTLTPSGNDLCQAAGTCTCTGRKH